MVSKKAQFSIGLILLMVGALGLFLPTELTADNSGGFLRYRSDKKLPDRPDSVARTILSMKEIRPANVNRSPGLIGSASAGALLINEVVTDPQQDWDGSGFTDPPDTGSVSQGVDEWIELYITASGLDLTGWTIELLDGTDVSGDLTASGAFQVSNYISAGGGSFGNTAAGDYLVLGNVAGAGAMNNDIWIVLKDDTGTVIDQVEIGDDPQGDGAGDGAPDGSGSDGNASDLTDEAIARIPNGFDSGNDVADFWQQAATIGASNDGPPTAIILVSFSATPGSNGVTLAWETGTEIDNAGFNLHRSFSEAGPWTKINPALIPAKGDPVSGASYSYLDTAAVDPETVYYYKLEDIDLNGVSTFHGPVDTGANPTAGSGTRLYLPLITQAQP